MKRAAVAELSLWIAIGLIGATMFAAGNIYSLLTTSHMIIAGW